MGVSHEEGQGGPVPPEFGECELALPLSIHQNTPFQAKNYIHFCSWEGPSPSHITLEPIPRPNQAFWISPVHPPEFQLIYPRGRNRRFVVCFEVRECFGEFRVVFLKSGRTNSSLHPMYRNASRPYPGVGGSAGHCSCHGENSVTRSSWRIYTRLGVHTGRRKPRSDDGFPSGLAIPVPVVSSDRSKLHLILRA